MIDADTFAQVLGEHFEYFAVLPDSKSTRVITSLRELVGPRVLQFTDEATAIGIAAGLTIANRTCLIMIESSGLRRGFEALGRLSGSHGVHPVILATDRGVLGDSDWWAAAHHPHAHSVAIAVSARTTGLLRSHSVVEIQDLVARAKRHHLSQQSPIVLWADPELTVIP